MFFHPFYSHPSFIFHGHIDCASIGWSDSVYTTNRVQSICFSCPIQFQFQKIKAPSRCSPGALAENFVRMVIAAPNSTKREVWEKVTKIKVGTMATSSSIPLAPHACCQWMSHENTQFRPLSSFSTFYLNTMCFFFFLNWTVPFRVFCLLCKNVRTNYIFVQQGHQKRQNDMIKSCNESVSMLDNKCHSGAKSVEENWR